MNNFDYNLALVLAHTLVCESRSCVTLYACGGNTMVQNSNESMNDILQAYKNNLGPMLNVLKAQQPSWEQSQLALTQALSPEYQKLQQQLYTQFGPELAKTASDIENQTALARAQGDAAVLAGPGAQIIAAAKKAAQEADPEYYASRAAVANKLQTTLGAMDPTRLTGGERAEIQRAAALAHKGPVQDAVDTASNAMQFGSALTNKQATIANTLNNSANALQSMKSSFDPTQVALGRPSTAVQQGAANSTGIQNFNNSQLFNQSSQLFGQAGNSNNMYNQGMLAQQNSNNQMKQMMVQQAMTGGGAASSCCFILLEAQNGLLPAYVRWCRDNLADEQTRVGYKRMARVLVPLMERFAVVKDLVNALMVEPLIRYGAWITCQPGATAMDRPYMKFWFGVWKLLGKY